MPMTPSQWQAEMRRRIDAYNRAVNQHNQAIKNAINDHNRKVNQHNAEVQRHNQALINNYNREVSRHNTEVRRRNQALKAAVDRYNSSVRSHNAAVLTNRQRIENALASARAVSVSREYAEYNTSVHSVNDAYASIKTSSGAAFDSDFGHLIERENVNSLETHNAILSGNDVSQTEGSAETALTPILAEISQDLANRWGGAIYSLSARNPDAARHFCTSSREILNGLIELQAPDDMVTAAMPECPKLDSGKPTRRAKIRFALTRNGIASQQVEDFVEKDIENVVQLFRVFNDATHGSAGTFGLRQLFALKKRVEDAVIFLASVFD